MNFFLRVVIVAMGAVVLALVAWVSTPSAMFFNPVSLTLEGERLTFVRDTPFGEVNILWIGEIILLDQDNFECSGQGNRMAQVADGNVVSANIGVWARPCIEAGAPFILRYQYQVVLWGLIPLRPVEISLKVNGEVAP